MNVYRVVIKGNDPERKRSSWGDSTYLIRAASFSNAEDKAKKLEYSGKIHSITYEGEDLRDGDIMEVNTKH